MSGEFETSSSQSSENVLLYHGTDRTSAHQIARFGLNRDMARRSNGDGSFWATTDQLTATIFAHANPSDGPPVMVIIEINLDAFNRIREMAPPILIEWEQSQVFEFLPSGYAVTNSAIQSIRFAEIEG